MSKITIDSKVCARCGTCVLSCSENVFGQPEKGALPELVREALCISCGHCVAICPHGAIAHADFPEGSVTPVRRELLPSAESVLEMLRARRSIRLFKDAPVERGVLERILEGARMAPSAHNFQTTEYLVIQDTELLRRIPEICARYYAKVAKQLRNPIVRGLYRLELTREEIESVVPLLSDLDMVVELAGKGEDPFLHHAPCLILCHAERNLNYPEANAILALHNATLVAQALGVGGYLVGYVVGACQRDKRIPALLSVPRNHGVYGALALGYPQTQFTKWPARRPLKVRWL